MLWDNEDTEYIFMIWLHFVLYLTLNLQNTSQSYKLTEA